MGVQMREVTEMVERAFVPAPLSEKKPHAKTQRRKARRKNVLKKQIRIMS